MTTFSTLGYERGRGTRLELFVTMYGGHVTGVEFKQLDEDPNASGGPTVRDYIGLVSQLDIDDPVGAAARYEEVQALIQQARNPPYEHSDAVSAAENAARRDQARSRLQQRARVVHRGILTDLHGLGDEYLKLLRPIVDECLDVVGNEKAPARAVREANERWQLCLKLTGLLRSRGLMPRATGAMANDYAFEHPERIHFWQVMNAARVQQLSQAPADPIYWSRVRPEGAPPITLSLAVEQGWGPGLRTAGEVVGWARAFQATLEQALHNEFEAAGQPASGPKGKGPLKMASF